MPMRLRTPLPSLDGVTEWLNGEPDLEAVKGSPLLVYFWAVSCHICHENMPKLKDWREKFVPKGLKMIAIHCPRMKSDTDVEKVKEAMAEYGIVEPCGVDNLHKVKNAFDNDLWPAYFIFDEEGNLKRRAAGNAGISMLEPILEKMFE
ncbi:MAG: redoxin domain-containing protein [Anaerolineaceae bacterium]|nr:redoxin domain-containing protein [Anaerolineaceae bacterium]